MCKSSSPNTENLVVRIPYGKAQSIAPNLAIYIQRGLVITAIAFILNSQGNPNDGNNVVPHVHVMASAKFKNNRSRMLKSSKRPQSKEKAKITKKAAKEIYAADCFLLK